VTHLIRTIDAHAGGQALRLIVDGARSPTGTTLALRADWLRRHADHIRKAVVLEPRGHVDMVAAQFVDPVAPGAHAGVIFMDGEGYRPMSGHGIIAATTIALERELFFARDQAMPDVRVTFDTPAGTVHARAHVVAGPDRLRVDSVRFTNVPAFVHTPGHPVRVGTRALRVDVAFGGLFYAIADTEAIGIPLTRRRLPELRRLAIDLLQAVNDSLRVEHPALRRVVIGGVVFTGPPQDPEAHLRTVAVSPNGGVNWSPSGTASSAVMSVLDAMQLLADGSAFVSEGLAGSILRGQISGRTAVGDYPALVTEVQGSAWITGEHTFCLDPDDPFREGLSPGG